MVLPPKIRSRNLDGVSSTSEQLSSLAFLPRL